MHACCLEFDEFEMFITKIYSKLKVLSITTEIEDMTSFNANHWEQLIRQYFLQLTKFYFRCYENINDEYESPMYLEEPKQFTSPFWTERQWDFEAEINSVHFNKVFIGILIEILFLLLELDSLHISSLLLSPERYSSIEKKTFSFDSK